MADEDDRDGLSGLRAFLHLSVRLMAWHACGVPSGIVPILGTSEVSAQIARVARFFILFTLFQK